MIYVVMYGIYLLKYVNGIRFEYVVLGTYLWYFNL